MPLFRVLAPPGGADKLAHSQALSPESPAATPQRQAPGLRGHAGRPLRPLFFLM